MLIVQYDHKNVHVMLMNTAYCTVSVEPACATSLSHSCRKVEILMLCAFVYIPANLQLYPVS